MQELLLTILVLGGILIALPLLIFQCVKWGRLGWLRAKESFESFKERK
jgi:hypothetical protein